jgi:release factor glutamine methyltransferase
LNPKLWLVDRAEKGANLIEEGLDEKSPWTPIRIIQWAIPYLRRKGIQNPRLDAEVLIAHALKIDRLRVYLQFDKPLNADELSLIRDLLKRRSVHEPIQYITGVREFYGMEFKVSSSVLIPRPETEQLVELAIGCLNEVPVEKRLVLELGTGSGCVAIAIAKNINCQVWAVDCSKNALEVAAGNGNNLGVDGFIRWREGDWYSALETDDPPQFQVIVSNPPYIASGEKSDLPQEVRDFEPLQALISGKSGLEVYETLSEKLQKRLIPGGVFILEIHPERHRQIVDIFSHKKMKVSLYKDLKGLPRVLKLEKSSIY